MTAPTTTKIFCSLYNYSARISNPIFIDFISIPLDNLAHNNSALLPKISNVTNSWIVNYTPLFFISFLIPFKNCCASFHSPIKLKPRLLFRSGASVLGRPGGNRTLFQSFGGSIAPCAPTRILEEMKRFELLAPIKERLFSRQVVSSTHPHFQNQLTPIVHICWVLILRYGSATSY